MTKNKSLRRLASSSALAMPPRPRLPAWRLPARHLHASAWTGQPRTAAPPLSTSIAASLARAATEEQAGRTELHGWIRSIRRQKNISFAVLSDGSQVGGVQVVLPKDLDDKCVLSLHLTALCRADEPPHCAA